MTASGGPQLVNGTIIADVIHSVGDFRKKRNFFQNMLLKLRHQAAVTQLVTALMASTGKLQDKGTGCLYSIIYFTNQ